MVPKNFPSYSKSRDPHDKMTLFLIILINCFAVCFARPGINFLYFSFKLKYVYDRVRLVTLWDRDFIFHWMSAYGIIIHVWVVVLFGLTLFEVVYWHTSGPDVLPCRSSMVDNRQVVTIFDKTTRPMGRVESSGFGAPMCTVGRETLQASVAL